MTDITFEDLAEEAGAAAQEAAQDGGGESTGEWIAQTVELLDKRGLIEPILFGPEQAQEVKQQQAGRLAAQQADESDEADESSTGGLSMDAQGIAQAGEAVMGHLGDDATVDDALNQVNEIGEGIKDQLGEDVTVAEIVEICERNPNLVNAQLNEHL